MSTDDFTTAIIMSIIVLGAVWFINSWFSGSEKEALFTKSLEMNLSRETNLTQVCHYDTFGDAPHSSIYKCHSEKCVENLCIEGSDIMVVVK